MELMLKADLKKLPVPIRYRDKILLIGSCFTEHIGNSLARLKFNTFQNPNGILFDPRSVTSALNSYISNRPVTGDEVFKLNETWNSWQHHSRFSSTDKDAVLSQVNSSRQSAHDFLKTAGWIIITLGSAFSYQLTSKATMGGELPGNGVANCHRAPADWFEKQLLGTDTITSLLENCYTAIKEFNPGLRLLLTVSPVRHIRDGVVENNRSKARLIESVHQLVNNYEDVFYFPAYELVIDVLRDYRFYDIDLIHPNYQATEFVLEKFTETCLDPAEYALMEDLKKIGIARRHKPFQPGTIAHRQFLSSHLEKVKQVNDKYPFIDLRDEIDYFSKAALS
jgi:hypothetical protein